MTTSLNAKPPGNRTIVDGIRLVANAWGSLYHHFALAMTDLKASVWRQLESWDWIQTTTRSGATIWRREIQAITLSLHDLHENVMAWTTPRQPGF